MANRKRHTIRMACLGYTEVLQTDRPDTSSEIAGRSPLCWRLVGSSCRGSGIPFEVAHETNFGLVLAAFQ